MKASNHKKHENHENHENYEKRNAADRKPSLLSRLTRIAKANRDRTVELNPTTLVCVTYALLLLTKIIDLTLINRENEYYSVVILQMMVFLLPGVIWCRFSGEAYVSRLRLRPFRASSILLILSAALTMIAGGLLISVSLGGLEQLSQNFSLYDTFISRDNGTVPTRMYLILAYAVLPAICEEFVFRGILCHEYERGGVLRAVLLSSLFFGLLHFNPANLPVYFFAGVILSMTLYATRSLFGAMLAHFLYNIFGLFGQPYMSTLYRITNSTALFLFVVGFTFLLSAAVFCGEAARLYRRYLYDSQSASYRQPLIRDRKSLIQSYTEVLKSPSAIVCYALYILALLIIWF